MSSILSMVHQQWFTCSSTRRMRVLIILDLLVRCIKGAEQSTNATATQDEENNDVLTKSMLIGLSVGFGTLCGVIIICCLCFKFCDCSSGDNRTRAGSRRRVAWS